MKRIKYINTVLSALFLALGLVLPLLTGQLKEIGDTLLPMHLPCFLCGALCGPWYGLFIGFIMPFLRSLLFSMPPMYPSAVWMAFELGTYGFMIGFMYKRLKKHSLLGLYTSLIVAMISGRAVWGIVKAILLGVGGNSFTFTAFFVGGVADALPGIILQLVIIPVIISIVEKVKNREGACNDRG